MTSTSKPPPLPTVHLPSTSIFTKVNRNVGQRVVLYGSGGIGKTTLAASAPGPVAFFDLDGSLAVLKLKNEPLLVRVSTWEEIKDAIQGKGWDEVRTICIDSLSKAEELATSWIYENIKTEKNGKAKSLPDYGWGEGYIHLQDTVMSLLADLDRHRDIGRNIVLICHDQTCEAPNPAGHDWLRFEPRLQNTKNAPLRMKVKEWADHVIFIGYDMEVDKDGKAKGQGTRTYYPTEKPWCLAKSRTLSKSEELKQDDQAFWSKLFGK